MSFFEDSRDHSDLALQQDEMDYLLELTEEKYSPDVIVMVHVGMMIVPRLKELGFFVLLIPFTIPSFAFQQEKLS